VTTRAAGPLAAVTLTYLFISAAVQQPVGAVESQSSLGRIVLVNTALESQRCLLITVLAYLPWDAQNTCPLHPRIFDPIPYAASEVFVFTNTVDRQTDRQHASLNAVRCIPRMYTCRSLLCSS